MSEIEKARIQRDARRRAAGSPGPSQAIIRHLGVELYQERRRTEHPTDDHGDCDEAKTGEGPTTR